MIYFHETLAYITLPHVLHGIFRVGREEIAMSEGFEGQGWASGVVPIDPFVNFIKDVLKIFFVSHLSRGWLNPFL